MTPTQRLYLVLLVLLVVIATIGLVWSLDTLLTMPTDEDVARDAIETMTASGMIKLEPSAGGPGTQVTITGWRWEAEEHIDLLLLTENLNDERPLGNVIADASGTFSAVITIPEVWSGGEVIQEGSLLIAAIPGSGPHASADFAFTP